MVEQTCFVFVGTMSDNETSGRPQIRTALNDIELDESKADVTPMQEVRFSGEGRLIEATRTFYSKGVAPGELQRASGGFANIY